MGWRQAVAIGVAAAVATGALWGPAGPPGAVQWVGWLTHRPPQVGSWLAALATLTGGHAAWMGLWAHQPRQRMGAPLAGPSGGRPSVEPDRRAPGTPPVIVGRRGAGRRGGGDPGEPRVFGPVSALADSVVGHGPADARAAGDRDRHGDSVAVAVLSPPGRGLGLAARPRGGAPAAVGRG